MLRLIRIRILCPIFELVLYFLLEKDERRRIHYFGSSLEAAYFRAGREEEI